MRNILIIILYVVAIVLSSCSTDLEINSEWEAIPVVYCILDQSKSEQYVKVSKVFLGELPAIEMAQVSDSLFYNDVDVVLYRRIGEGDYQWVSNFEATDEIPKDSGMFAYDRNTLFVSNVDLQVNDALGNPYEYKLEVIINDIGETVTGTTKLISGAQITSPQTQATSVSMYNYLSDFQYKYRTGDNSSVLQMTLRFNYLEVIDGDTTDQTIFIDWPQAMKAFENTNSIEITSSFSVLAFYNLLISNIPVNENARRLVKMPNSLEFRLAAGDEDFYTYMQISAPSNGLAQSRPLFTNIENGVGLFSSRYNTSRIKKMNNRTIDSISRGIYTKDLNFVNQYDSYYTPYFK